MRLIGLAVVLTVSLLAPLAAEAQTAGKVYRIGFLQGAPNTPAINYTETFRQGLRDHGCVEGQNIVIEHRLSKTPQDNPAILADLLDRKIDILVTWTTPALVAAKKATGTIPIVGISGNPVETGLVASLARPGGNLTGIAILSDELELKNLQLLKEAFPGVTRVAVLWNPDNPVWLQALKRLQAAAPMLGVTIHPYSVRDLRELEAAFAAATKEKARALLVFREQVLTLHRQQIVNFVTRHRLPAIYGGPPFVEVGG
jgi:putative tryptophan/tyrosine transport system substrate-binding protein